MAPITGRSLRHHRALTLAAAAYLDFRREYYHKAAPVLETDPPLQAEIRQAEVARLAESILRMVPPGIKLVAIVGGLLEHL